MQILLKRHLPPIANTKFSIIEKLISHLPTLKGTKRNILQDASRLPESSNIAKEIFGVESTILIEGIFYGVN